MGLTYTDTGEEMDKESYEGSQNKPETPDDNQDNKKEWCKSIEFRERYFISGRENALENMRPIERKKRNEIEKSQGDIDHHPEKKKLHYTGGKTDTAAIGGPESDSKKESQSQVGKRPGGRNPEIGHPRIAQIVGIDRNRLGPAEAESRNKHHNGAEKIEMGQRIESQPPHIAGGCIAEPESDISMEKFMHRQREKYRRSGNQRLLNKIRSKHLSSPFAGRKFFLTSLLRSNLRGNKG
jgi:hypothetical protein